MTSASDTLRCASQLRRTVAHLYQSLRPGLRQAGISMAKLSVVGQVFRAGALTPTELAAREGVKIQTLTRVLAELEAEGWLRREPHAADGRQSLLSLTPFGKGQLAKVGRASDAALTEAMQATLQPEDLALLQQACVVMERLDAALAQAFERADSRSGEKA